MVLLRMSIVQGAARLDVGRQKLVCLWRLIVLASVVRESFPVLLVLSLKLNVVAAVVQGSFRRILAL